MNSQDPIQSASPFIWLQTKVRVATVMREQEHESAIGSRHSQTHPPDTRQTRARGLIVRAFAPQASRESDARGDGTREKSARAKYGRSAVEQYLPLTFIQHIWTEDKLKLFRIECQEICHEYLLQYRMVL